MERNDTIVDDEISIIKLFTKLAVLGLFGLFLLT